MQRLERPYIIVIEAPRFAPDGYPIEIGIAMDLSRLLFGKMVYSDGWVVDQPWLTKLFYAAHVPQDFRISALELILTEAQMAIHMALFGGLGVIHCNNTIEGERSRPACAPLQSPHSARHLHTGRDSPLTPTPQ